MDYKDEQLLAIKESEKRGSAGVSTTKTHAQIASSTLIVEATSTGIGATIYNSTDNKVYIKLGETSVSSTDYTVIMNAGDYYEAPYKFQGKIWAIKDAAVSSGSIYITAIT